MKGLLALLLLAFIISPPSLFYEDAVHDDGAADIKSIEAAHEMPCIIQNGSFRIFYPRCSSPAIVERGDEFTIILQNFSYDGIDVKISTAYEPVIDEFYLEVKEFHGNEVVVEVPDNVPPELYNLTVIGIEKGKYFAKTEPRAVSIMESIDGNFTFVHLTDFHIGDPRGMKVSIRETIGWKAAKKCIEEINLLHPDFVVITGDLVFGQLYPFEYSYEYRTLYKVLQQFDVPTFLCPGNHDGYIQCGQDGFKFWQEYFGPLYYSFDYGKAHFVMANSYDWPSKNRVGFSYVVFQWGGYMQDEQLHWIENDLKESDAKLKVIALHHNPLWDTANDSLFRRIGYRGREQLLSFIELYDVDAVLAGHVHYDDVTIVNDTVYITTTTAASSLDREDAYWGYRLIEVRNWSIYSYNYKEPKYSIPSYRLNISYLSEEEAVVENNLDMDVDILLKFTIPAEYEGKYSVKNGEAVMERSDANLLQIYVKAKVEKRTEKEIGIELL